MDNHTFINKQRVGTTDLSDFTDFQGIGHDPMYRRYDSVLSIVRRFADSRYVDFLAAPDYSAADDAVNWYIPKWTDTPQRLATLSGAERSRYDLIYRQTLDHYRQMLNQVSGQELQILAAVLKYVNPDFIFCADGKVYALAWGMTPDTRKHIETGLLVHDAPMAIRYTVTFDPGEGGRLADPRAATISLPQGTVLTANDVPQLSVDDDYVFTGWTPQPVGLKLDSDLTVTACYRKHIPLPPVPPPPPEPELAHVRFDAGKYGTLQGQSEFTRMSGSKLAADEIPLVQPVKGWLFKGWNVDPLALTLDGDMVVNAVYEKQLPWYRRLPKWLRWLLWLLLALLLLLLAAWLLRGCHGCTGHREVNGVVDVDRRLDSNGDTIDDNGYIRPIEVEDGALPDDQAVAAPLYDEGGNAVPVVEEPGMPTVVANRLFLFLQSEDDSVDQLAAAFKQAYPSSQYSIIGYDRQAGYVVVQVPEAERDRLRNDIPQRIKSPSILVLDEEYYSSQRHDTPAAAVHAASKAGAGCGAAKGWHLDAINARQGWQITTGSPEVTVAVVDDGIDAGHPMFKGRLTKSYNVYTQNNRLSRGGGHGTHVAALAAGSHDNLSQGVAGIAPQCHIMPVQVFDNDGCPTSALVSGIMYAIRNGADVVNISAGPDLSAAAMLSPEEQLELSRRMLKNQEALWTRINRLAASKNCILVFAAGNEEVLSCLLPENRTPWALTIGATAPGRQRAGFTNYGPGTSVSAPGVDIWSAKNGGGFTMLQGTSQAAPIVSGAVALMKSLKRDLTVEQARNVLQRTGVPVAGNMPPQLQLHAALDAVRRGDFSPAPQAATGGGTANGGSQPAGGSADCTTGGGAANTGTGVVATGPAQGAVGTPATPAPVRPAPAQGGSDGDGYDELRRRIRETKRQVAEWESQLPENRKKETIKSSHKQ